MSDAKRFMPVLQKRFAESFARNVFSLSLCRQGWRAPLQVLAALAGGRWKLPLLRRVVRGGEQAIRSGGKQIGRETQPDAARLIRAPRHLAADHGGSVQGCDHAFQLERILVEPVRVPGNGRLAAAVKAGGETPFRFHAYA